MSRTSRGSRSDASNSGVGSGFPGGGFNTKWPDVEDCRRLNGWRSDFLVPKLSSAIFSSQDAQKGPYLTRPTPANVPPALPTDCFAIDFPGRSGRHYTVSLDCTQ